MRSEESVAKVKLIGTGKKQSTHVDWEKVGAMTTSHSDILEQAGARNTHLKCLKLKQEKEEGACHVIKK